MTYLMVVKDLPRGAGDRCLYKGLTGERAQLYQPEEPARWENQTSCTASFLMLTPVNLGSEVLKSALLFLCLISCPSISTPCSVWKGASDLCWALQSFQRNRQSFMNNFWEFFLCLQNAHIALGTWHIFWAHIDILTLKASRYSYCTIRTGV